MRSLAHAHSRALLSVFGILLEEDGLVLNLAVPEFSSSVVQRAVVVGLSEKTLQRDKDGGDAVGSGPLFLQNIEANVAVLVNVGVEAGSNELYQGGVVPAKAITGKFERRVRVGVVPSPTCRVCCGVRCAVWCGCGVVCVAVVCGSTYGYSSGNFMDNVYFKPAYTVPSGPTIEHVHSNKLSPLGKALMSSFPPTYKDRANL